VTHYPSPPRPIKEMLVEKINPDVWGGHGRVKNLVWSNALFAFGLQFLYIDGRILHCNRFLWFLWGSLKKHKSAVRTQINKSIKYSCEGKHFNGWVLTRVLLIYEVNMQLPCDCNESHWHITSTSSNLFQRRFINLFRIYIIYITARQILQYYKCMGLNTAYNVLILYILAIGHVG